MDRQKIVCCVCNVGVHHQSIEKKVCVKGESNPQLNLGRVPCYHYTINALSIDKIITICNYDIVYILEVYTQSLDKGVWTLDTLNTQNLELELSTNPTQLYTQQPAARLSTGHRIISLDIT